MPALTTLFISNSADLNLDCIYLLSIYSASGLIYTLALMLLIGNITNETEMLPVVCSSTALPF
jgi:hypothetical protein